MVDYGSHRTFFRFEYAFQTAIVVAFMNIKIPILLGDLINIIAGFIRNRSMVEFSQLNPIATRLLGLYFAQVCL